jgi:hypothetical protein
MNPEGARELLAILRTAPAAVKYKPEDTFGPLGMMVTETGPPAQNPSQRGLSRPGLPPQLHGAAEAFQKEWLGRGFTKAELADELERCLNQLGEEALPEERAAWQTIGREADQPDPLSNIFPDTAR